MVIPIRAEVLTSDARIRPSVFAVRDVFGSGLPRIGGYEAECANDAGGECTPSRVKSARVRPRVAPVEPVEIGEGQNGPA